MGPYSDSNSTHGVWIIGNYNSGDNAERYNDNSNFYNEIYFLEDENDMFHVEYPAKTKQHRRIKTHSIKYYPVIKVTVFTRRAMFSKSGYLPWRVRRRIKNAN